MIRRNDDIERNSFNDFEEQTVRMNFIRKVYSILMVQLMINIAFIAWFYFDETTRRWVEGKIYLAYVALFFMLLIYYLFICVDDARREAPMNFIFLFLFTICVSFLLSLITAYYNIDAILYAACLTALVCFALTIFSFQSVCDFTACSGFILAFFVIVFMSSIVLWIFPSKITYFIYVSLAALLYSIFFIYDTQLILGGDHMFEFSEEEYIFAALVLYMDVVRMFLLILQLLGGYRD